MKPRLYTLQIALCALSRFGAATVRRPESAAPPAGKQRANPTQRTAIMANRNRRQFLTHWHDDHTDVAMLHVTSKQRRSARRLTNWLREHREGRAYTAQRVRQGLLPAKGQ